MHDYFSYLHDFMKIIIHAGVITLAHSYCSKETDDSDSTLCSITLYYTSNQFPNTKRITDVWLSDTAKKYRTKEIKTVVVWQTKLYIVKTNGETFKNWKTFIRESSENQFTYYNKIAL